MGVLNVQKWCHGNIINLTSWVLWIFMKWPYGDFEYSWGDVIGILNTHEVTFWKYSEADVMGILKFIFKITRLLNIQNTHDITSRIFKIPMSLWIFKNIPKYPWRQLLNIQNASWVIWIFECWRHGYFEDSWSDVIGLLNTHEWPHG